MKDSTKNMESLLQDVAPKPRSTIVWGTALVLAALPFVISTPLATEILIWAIFGIGFNLLLGYTGVLSFGHSAYFGMGAYGMGLALRYWHVGVLGGLAVGIVSSMLLACLIGVLAIRSRGVYFAMISLAFGQMLYFLALSPLKHITRGEDGLTHIPQVDLFFIALHKPRPIYYFILAITVALLYLTWRILQSPFGKLLRAFRENEERAKACGYNTDAGQVLHPGPVRLLRWPRRGPQHPVPELRAAGHAVLVHLGNHRHDDHPRGEGDVPGTPGRSGRVPFPPEHDQPLHPPVGALRRRDLRDHHPGVPGRHHRHSPGGIEQPEDGQAAEQGGHPPLGRVTT